MAAPAHAHDRHRQLSAHPAAEGRQRHQPAPVPRACRGRARQSRLSADGQPAGVRRLGAGAGHVAPGKAFERPLVGVPVVLMQQSAYGMLWCARQPAARSAPADGRTIGVRAYTQTTGVVAARHAARSVRARPGEPALGDVRARPRRRLRRSTQRPARCRRHDAGRHAARRRDRRRRGPRAGRVSGPAHAASPTRWTGRSGVDLARRAFARSTTPWWCAQTSPRTNPWVADELFAHGAAPRSSSPVARLRRTAWRPIAARLNLLARYTFEQHITPRTLTVEELFPAAMKRSTDAILTTHTGQPAAAGRPGRRCCTPPKSGDAASTRRRCEQRVRGAVADSVRQQIDSGHRHRQRRRDEQGLVLHLRQRRA